MPSELYGYDIDDLVVGMTALFSKTITEADITLFAGVSGDTNPVHLDQAFAEQTMFKGRIAHGMLSAALISTVIGTKLPGPGCVYLSQTLKFLAPVRAGDTVVARVTVTELRAEKRRLTLHATCHVGMLKVVDGEALIMIPKREAVETRRHLTHMERLAKMPAKVAAGEERD